MLQEVLGPFTRLFLANTCPLCDRSTGEVLCQSCHGQMLSSLWPVATLADPRMKVPPTTDFNLFAWGAYSGLLKQALALLKYGNKPELGIWLGVQLGAQWYEHYGATLRHKPLMIPIPLHRERQQQRGYNQASLIAKGFCRATGLRYIPNGLIRKKNTCAMHSLGVAERKANLWGAFQLGTSLPKPSRPIWLIDDIYTTGSTALAATVVLRQAGYNVLGMITVARAMF
ncbi:MAG: ComF family protein [Cyanobacteria bacterium P01_D01_bin.156]